MTTYHDPAPASRRAARRSERDSSEQGQGFTFPVQPTPFVQPPHSSHAPDELSARGRRSAAAAEPLIYATQGTPPVPHYDGPSFRQQPAPGEAELPATQAIPTSERPTYRRRDFSPEGRRAAAPVTQPASTPLDYHTQNRTPQPPVATQAPAAFVQPASSSQAPADRDQAPAEHTLSRRELRALREREAAATAPSVEDAVSSTPAAPAQVAPAPVAFAPVAPAPAPVAPAPVAFAPVAPASLSELPPLIEPGEAPVTSTLAAAASTPLIEPVAAQPLMPAPVAPAAPVEPFAFAEPTVSEAFTTPATADASAEWPVPAASAEPVSFETLAAFAESSAAVPVARPQEAFVAPAAPAQHESDAAPSFDSLFPQRAPEPVASTGLTDARAEFEALTRPRPLADSSEPLPFLLGPTPPSAPVAEPVVVAPEPLAPQATPYSEPLGTAAGDVSEPAASFAPDAREVEPPSTSTWTAPANHWSRQLDLEDETQPYESTINRVVGGSNTTTNALMLPTIPHGDIRGALIGTGEVMLTGSIDLPRSFAATGSTIQLEHSGIDALFDDDDHESVSTDSAPVRAARAVSSRSQGTLTPSQKPPSSKWITVLLVSACGLAVVVTGLVVTALVFNLF